MMTEKQANKIGLFIVWGLSIVLGPIMGSLVIEVNPTVLGLISVFSWAYFVVATAYWVSINWGRVFSNFVNGVLSNED